MHRACVTNRAIVACHVVDSWYDFAAPIDGRYSSGLPKATKGPSSLRTAAAMNSSKDVKPRCCQAQAMAADSHQPECCERAEEAETVVCRKKQDRQTGHTQNASEQSVEN